MAFPAIVSTATSYCNTDRTSHAVTLPSGLEAGNLLLILFVTDGTPGVTAPDGYYSQGEKNGTATQLLVSFKVIDGTEGSSLTITTTSSEQSAHLAIQLSGAAGIRLGGGATGTTSQPNPGSFTTPWDEDDTLWIATCGWDYNRSLSAYPSNYSYGLWTRANTTGGCGVAAAFREYKATSEDPSYFTLSYGDEWAAITIGVCPASQVLCGMDPKDGAYSAGALYTEILAGLTAHQGTSLHTIRAYANTNVTNLKVGGFTRTDTNKFTGPGSGYSVGNVTSGAVRTITGCSVPMTTGQFLGCYWSGGNMEYHQPDRFGLYEASGDKFASSDVSYSLYSTGGLSIEGIGLATVTHLCSLTATLTLSGIALKSSTRYVLGALSSSGALLRSTLYRISGSLTSSGVLSRFIFSTLLGSLATTGTALKSSTRYVLGALSSSGTLLRSTGKVSIGSVASSGALGVALLLLKAISGAIIATGAVRKGILRSLAGAISTTGGVARHVTARLAGSLQATGHLLFGWVVQLQGTLQPTGALFRGVAVRLAGSATAIGATVWTWADLVVSVAVSALRKFAVTLLRRRQFEIATSGAREFSVTATPTREFQVETSAGREYEVAVEVRDE